MTLSVNPPKVCVRCKVNKPNRPRGLCWHCYYTPGVRERYGPTTVHGRRGIGHNDSGAKPLDPRGGTAHPPGSLGRIAVMAERAELGYAILHPDDARDYTHADPSEAPENPADERKAGRNVRSGYRRRSQRDRTECEQAREPRGTAHGFARDIARTY
jgi:hypothetical protein